MSFGIVAAMHQHGSGVYSWAELAADGVTQAQLRRAFRDGTAVKVRHGWYALGGADPQVIAAVAAGGAMSCVSALDRYGVWVPPTPKLLHVRGNSSTWRSTSHDYCRQYQRPQPVRHAIDGPDIALRHALRCLEPDGIVAVCDSLLNLSRNPQTMLLRPHEIVAAFDGAPERVRACLSRTDGRAQSGLESLVRQWLRGRGVSVRVQVWIPGLGHVDLLVGERLIIEVDGRAHHTGASNYAEDRRRDRVAASQNLLRMRLTYENVMFGWDDVVGDILAAVHHRYHRAPRSRS
ncbi:type IV toxin-antitoxin system AbiEi family antitoxin domain-containing protein [Gordonia sinesedis]